MESLGFINDLLDYKIVLGDKLEIGEGLFIIPVYKSKVSFINLKTDLKANIGDGFGGSLNVFPICLLKVFNNNVEVINFKEEKDNIIDVIPSIMSNLDINELIKNIKI